MSKIYITRQIPDLAINMLKEQGHEVDVSQKDGVLTREELIAALKAKPYDGVLCLLTDKIDGEVMDAVPTAKIFANYAVGFDNLNIPDAKQRGVFLTNTPCTSMSNSVAEHALALMVSVGRKIVEADQFIRDGKFVGWAPMLFVTPDLVGRTLGIIGLGRIGSRLAYHGARGFDMKVTYYDVVPNEKFEQEFGAVRKATIEEVLKEADYISLNVPLNDSTRGMMNKERLAMLKPSAILVNTSRGPVIDEAALVEVLKENKIAGAGLDVFEHEPALAPGLAQLPNVVLTPHIASATWETRNEMAKISASNIIATMAGQTPPNLVQ